MVAFLIKGLRLRAANLPAVQRAALDGEEIVLKDYVHIGFAVDTPKGLMAPVVRDCDVKGVFAIAAEVAVLAARAREGALSSSQMQGGCFSVSSLGGVGGLGFTPIINAPEVAILGAGRSVMESIWDGQSFRPRLMLPISLSWDHRIIDGVAAARFLGAVADMLRDLRRGLL